jgi:hypothetical protein
MNEINKLTPEIRNIIAKYNLIPHPEGGFYKEVYRSGQVVLSNQINENRNSVTHIYFLLCKGQFSRFHSVLHDEIWNFYEGDPLKLIEFDGKHIEENVIGKEIGVYVSIVKGGVFQAAETTGEYSLVGCSVAPGFDFKDFSFLDDKSDMHNTLLNEFPNFLRLK